MDTLFTAAERYQRNLNAPLAVRMRPQTLDGFVGQEAAVGEGSWLRRAIERDALSSIILYGPAGTGKTTLARIIANTTHAEFVEVSAVTGTVKDLRREIDAAENRLLVSGRRTILFVDEIHRFNRSQQDALLHAVEDRVVVLIGATTENPFFEVNSALISRSRVIELAHLSDEDVAELVRRACASEHGLKGAFVLEEEALSEIVTLSGGDARAALTSLELASQMAAPLPETDSLASSTLVPDAWHAPAARASAGALAPSAAAMGNATAGRVEADSPASLKSAAGVGDATAGARTGVDTSVGASGAQSPDQRRGEQPASKGPITITVEHVREANPRRGLTYDKSGDMHYDIISAFIKSMRGSDPDAAVYWLARMVDSGEDPKFIARRIFILASEDIGNADPQAILVAEAAFKACEVIGYPECAINLAQAATYMALAPKSNASYMALARAREDIHGGPARAVPNHLRDRHRPGSDAYGPYLYPHDYPEGWVDQRYLPEGLERGAFYHGGQRGWELWREDATGRDRNRS